MHIRNHKQFTRCLQSHPPTLVYFPKNKNCKDGLSSWCRTCHNASSKRWRADHPNIAKESSERWRSLHRDQETSRSKRWQKENPTKVRIRDQRRRAHKRGLSKTLTLAEWESLLILYDHRCAYCGTRCDALAQEHVIPIVQGGGYTKENIVPACKSCNSKKGPRTPEQARMTLIRFDFGPEP